MIKQMFLEYLLNIPDAIVLILIPNVLFYRKKLYLCIAPILAISLITFFTDLIIVNDYMSMSFKIICISVAYRQVFKKSILLCIIHIITYTSILMLFELLIFKNILSHIDIANYSELEYSFRLCVSYLSKTVFFGGVFMVAMFKFLLLGKLEKREM